MQYLEYIKKYPNYSTFDDCYKLGIAFQYIQEHLSKVFSINTYFSIKKNISTLENYIKRAGRYYEKD